MSSKLLVGRDAELAELSSLLDQARTGAGGAGLIVAEAGGGKTSLAAEAAARAAAEGMAVLWGTASDATASVPWLPVAEALNNGLAGVDADTLRRRLGPRHRLAGLVAPALFPDHVAQRVDESAKVAVFDALLGVVTEFGSGRGVVLVLDDLQWADATTQQFAAHAAARAAYLPLALLLTWRDMGEDRVLNGLLRQPGTLTIRPHPLGPLDLARLARELLGSQPGQALLTQVAEHSAGNPFAASELLLAHGRGDAGEALPANVREAVLGRARGLRQTDQATLQAISVLGREFDAALVERIVRTSPSTAAAALRRLVDAGLVERTARGRHRFRHAIIATAVRSEIDDTRLREAHAAAADALKELDAPPAELAHHLFAGGRGAEAVPIALAAAETAERWGGNVEASLLFEQAAAAQAGAGERGEYLDRAAFNALVAFQVDRAGELAERAIAALRDAGRPAARARATYSQTLARRGRQDEAEAERKQALAELAGAPLAHQAHVLMMLSAQLMALLQPEEAISLAERAVVAADAVGDERSSAMARGVIATCLGILGRLDEGIRLTDEAAEWGFQHRLYMPTLAAVHNASQLRAIAMRGHEAWARLEDLSEERKALLQLELHRVQAMLLAFIGAPAEVLRLAEKALLTAAPADVARLAINQAMALVQLDRAEEALELLDRTVTDRGAIHVRLQVTMVAHLALGNVVAAASEAQQYLALPLSFAHWSLAADAAVESLMAAGQQRSAYAALRARRGQADEANPWWRLAWAWVDLEGNPTSARDSAAAAAATFEEAGYPWYAGRANLLLAEAMRAVGDRDAARTTLHRVLANAKPYGIAQHVRIARERLAALGDRADLLNAQAVRGLLERLDDLPPEPRLRLLGAIDALTAAGGREAEAGTILRDYYVTKVGSQEVVAERHYLTRPTFYRRLHLGWELLAERLGSLDETPVASAPGS